MIIRDTGKPLFKKVTSIPTGTDVWTGNNLSVRAEIGIFAPAMKILFVINIFKNSHINLNLLKIIEALL